MGEAKPGHGKGLQSLSWMKVFQTCLILKFQQAKITHKIIFMGYNTASAKISKKKMVGSIPVS